MYVVAPCARASRPSAAASSGASANAWRAPRYERTAGRAQPQRGGRGAQALLAVRELLLEGRPGEPRALPAGIVAVLDRQRGRRRAAPVARGHLVDE
jgi:hypothetical protein